jgi:4-hydroxy-tetrahydrodipicolinate synthase
MDTLAMEGVVVPIVTPLDEDECVDEAGMRKAVNYMVERGIHGIFVLGTTGEGPALTAREWPRAVQIVVEETRGRVPVLAGISAPGTRLALERLYEVQRLGADAAVATVPYYQGLREEEIITHYRALSDAASIPVYGYNTGQGGMYFNLNIVAALASMKHIAGFKDASGNFTMFQHFVSKYDRDDFSIMQGNETMLAASVFAGGSGAVASLANLAPRLCVDIFEASKARDYERAFALQRKLLSLSELYRVSPSVISAFKYATSLLGLGSERSIKPFSAVTPAEKEAVRAKLQELGLL